MSWYTDWTDTAANNKLSGVVTPSVLSEDQWAFDPDPARVAGIWEVSSSAPVTLTGLQGGKIGRLVVFLNTGLEDITLAHPQLVEEKSNTVDVTLAPNTGVMLWLEPTTVAFSVMQTTPDPAPTIDYLPVNHIGPVTSARLIGRTTAGSGPAEQLTAASALTLIGAQPLDSDLSAIAALATTSYGRSFLALADSAAALTLSGAQPVDSDLTAIAALTTTSYGRSFLTQPNSAAALTLVGAQPLDSDLTAIAALATTSYGRSFLTQANSAAALTLVGAQPLDSDLTAIAALATTSYGRAFLALADAAAGRSALGLGSLATQSAFPTATFGNSAGFAGFLLLNNLLVQPIGCTATLPAIGFYLVLVNARILTTAGYNVLAGHIQNTTSGTLYGGWIIDAQNSVFDRHVCYSALVQTFSVNNVFDIAFNKSTAAGTINIPSQTQLQYLRLV